MLFLTLSFSGTVITGCNNSTDTSVTPDEEQNHAAEYSLFDATEMPARETTGQNDMHPIETGVKFRVNVEGKIGGVKFYKAASDTGSHIATLWDEAGNKLASATFKNETDSGWQEVRFATPVSVSPGSIYVASYFSSAGFYSFTHNSFDQPLEHYPLIAIQNDSLHANGIFNYADGDTSVFPTSSFRAPNYWVDVFFTPDKPIADSTRH